MLYNIMELWIEDIIC